MSTSIFEQYARSRLEEYAEPFVELMRQGSHAGARDLVLQVERENPLFSTAIKALFSGTPAEVVEAVAGWWPDVCEVPNVEAFFAVLQRLVRAEWEKPRSFLPPRRKD